MQQQHECWLSAAGAAPSRQSTLWLQQKEKNQELRIEKIRGTANAADFDDETCGWETFGNVVRAV